MRTPALVLVLLLSACHRRAAQAPVAPSPLAPKASTATPTEAIAATVSGKVVARLDAPPYSYLRLATGGGEQWAAVPKCQAKPGDEVVVEHAMRMDGFESKTLERKFEHIVFGTLQGEGSPVPSAVPTMPPGHPAVGQAAAVPSSLGPIAVRRAAGPNGVTVAELFAKKNAWQGKTVRVQGKVVKVLPAILGKNWIHVRDGSGSDEGKDNDLTLTSDDTASLGDVILVEGRVQADKDLGSGYRFPVLLENARISKAKS